ncbi:MarR family winged helix-turn-helix transcriptional regulator [Sphingomonas sp. SRS2]|uniref:MarR family winged helix-turn-helix transcriptional regulator n=1 Tax=Sphingomonas sp. SRS2 TaxID=133190 RepID=UPI000697DFEB|nr:MarR family winged helix-turn-helix transcriptional regulator [Sphingomonas sp. SRS2]
MADSEALKKLKQFDLLAAPGHLLRRNHQRSFDIFTRHVGDDVTRQQIALLLALNQCPGASQRELVEATGIDKSTLKEMLSRMIARGWVDRERDKQDSRAWTMRITALGEALLIDRADKLRAAQREILEPLSKEDRIVFMRCLRQLIGLDAL